MHLKIPPIFLAIWFIFFLASCGKNDDAQAPVETVARLVKTMSITYQEIKMTDRVPGKVLASKRAELKFQASVGVNAIKYRATIQSCPYVNRSCRGNPLWLPLT